MWQDHVTYAPALTIADRSALAKYGSCQPTTATNHATWTQIYAEDAQRYCPQDTTTSVLILCRGAELKPSFGWPAT